MNAIVEDLSDLPPGRCPGCQTPPEPTRLCDVHRHLFVVDGWREDRYSHADYARLSCVKASRMEVPISMGGFSGSLAIERIAHLVPAELRRFDEAFVLTRVEATEWWELIHDRCASMETVARNIGSYWAWSLTPQTVAGYGPHYGWWQPHLVAFWAHCGYDVADVPTWCRNPRNPMQLRAVTDALHRLLPGWVDP